ncbi:hypothetical protein [Streptomyces sp. NPDC047928]|uniref:hypothetical protein n=1 Tax=unclassified Streptomyces TaxID=2593676 RepID=UPI003722DD79
MAGQDRGGGRRRGRIRAAVLAVVVLASATGVLAATDSWPFRDSYCWGAWQQNSGPYFLGDEPLDQGAKRTGTQSAPPSAGQPEALCEVLVLREVPSDDPSSKTVTAEYGRVPADAEERREWLAHFLSGSATLLPDGLDGVVAEDRAMLVLPEACDVDGKPSTVTIRTDGGSIGELDEVTGMLLNLADKTMKAASCAPDTPLRVRSPMVAVAESEESEYALDPLCRIPGMRFDYVKEYDYEQQVGVVDDRLRTCSVLWETRYTPREPAGQYVMAGTPRFAALFAGLPEGVDHGLVRTTCKGRPTVYYGSTGEGLRGLSVPDDRTVFRNFVQSVSAYMGCENKGTVA